MPRWAKLALGPALGLGVWASLGTGVSPEAGRLAAVLVAAVSWWILEVVPLPLTALLASCACVVLKVGPAKQVLAPYADPIIFLFLGSFWIAEAMTLHGLDRRLAISLLAWEPMHRTPGRFLIGLGAISAFVSLWVSNTATTAMMLPLTLGMLAALPSAPEKLQARALLMIAWGASLGGIGTPVGTPPNLIGMGMLENLAGIKISFLGWMAFAMPLVAASMLFLAFLFLRGLHRPPGWEHLKEHLGQHRRSAGRFTAGERNTLMAFGVAAALWVFGGKWVPEGPAAVLAASLLFILPLEDGRATLTWREAARIDWGTLLLFGGGMSLGQLLFETKLAESLGQAVTATLGLGTPLAVAGLSSALALVTSELASNTASANVAVPVALALSRAAGVSPLAPALSATLASSFGFLLPVSTPPNALVYGTGKVPLRMMIRYGLALDLFGFFVAWLGLRYLPLPG